jgi:hypothetical protein
MRKETRPRRSSVLPAAANLRVRLEVPPPMETEGRVQNGRAEAFDRIRVYP